MQAFVGQAAVRCVVLWETQQRLPHKHPAETTHKRIVKYQNALKYGNMFNRKRFAPVFSWKFPKSFQQSYKSLLVQASR